MLFGRLSLICSITFFLICPMLKAEKLITLFVRPYPTLSSKDKADKIMAKVANPAKLARQHLKHVLNNSRLVSGIFATYGGFITISDLNGQIRFPRQHDKPHISLLITERITPIVRSGNTLSHWEINTDYATAMYEFVKITDPKSSLEYFEAREVALPANNVVPLESIVLFAKPKFIEVPQGVTMSYQSPHLILPDIYVKKGITLTDESLYVLNVAQYYGLLTMVTKAEPRRYSTHLMY